MTPLSTFLSRILSLLGDPLAARYSNTILGEAITQALEEYSIAIPNLAVKLFTVASAGRDQQITSIPSFLNVLQVVFPYDSAASEQLLLDAYYAFHDGAYLALYLGGPAVPAPGDIIQIYYTTPHTIKDLSGALATTVNPAHDSLLAQGAAGFAALLRAAQMVESPGKRVADVELLQKWGAEQRHKFSASLQLLAAAAGSHTSTLPTFGWKLDLWDTRG